MMIVIIAHGDHDNGGEDDQKTKQAPENKVVMKSWLFWCSNYGDCEGDDDDC